MEHSLHPKADGQPNPGSPTGGTPSQAVSWPQADRRKKRRAVISCPLRVRGVGSNAEASEEVSTTTDVSRNGILFVTSNQRLHRGMEVAVTLPYTKSADVRQSERLGSIVRVVALSNGTVAVAIAFGLSPLPRTETPPRVAALAGGRIEDNKSRKPLILLVEADLPNRDSLKAYLSTQGYRVLAVSGASEGREVLNAVTPALLIAEIEGEGLPGFDLCVHVKATPRLKHIPVMLTTKSAYPTDYSNAHSLGAVVCIAKPYRQERIGHVVRLLVPPVQTETTEGPVRSGVRSCETRPQGKYKTWPRR